MVIKHQHWESKVHIKSCTYIHHSFHDSVFLHFWHSKKIEIDTRVPVYSVMQPNICGYAVFFFLSFLFIIRETTSGRALLLRDTTVQSHFINYSDIVHRRLKLLSAFIYTYLALLGTQLLQHYDTCHFGANFWMKKQHLTTLFWTGEKTKLTLYQCCLLLQWKIPPKVAMLKKLLVFLFKLPPPLLIKLLQEEKTKHVFMLISLFFNFMTPLNLVMTPTCVGSSMSFKI